MTVVNQLPQIIGSNLLVSKLGPGPKPQGGSGKAPGPQLSQDRNVAWSQMWLHGSKLSRVHNGPAPELA